MQVEGGVFQREANGAHRRAFHEAGFQRVPDAGGFGLKARPALGLTRPGELGDGVKAAGVIGPQIKAGAILPGVAGEPIGFVQGEMRVERGAGIGEDAFEHRAVGENSGAGIHGHAAHIDRAQLAAGGAHALHHRDRHAARRQQHSSRQARHAGSDDDNAVRACQIALPNHLSLRSGS